MVWKTSKPFQSNFIIAAPLENKYKRKHGKKHLDMSCGCQIETSKRLVVDIVKHDSYYFGYIQ